MWINKPTASPPSSQSGPALLSILPSSAPRVRPSRPAGPQSAACPLATLFAGPPHRPRSTLPPPTLPLQLLIFFHRGARGAAPGNPQVVLAKRTLFPMSRKMPAKQEGRHHRRKERVTEGGGRSRSGAAGPDWGAERKQNTPPGHAPARAGPLTWNCGS